MPPPRLLAAPPRLPLVGASILSADFARMGEECRDALDRGADFLHLDVMDGHFVPNLTMGPDMCRALRRAFPSVWLDVHLMVQHPGRFIEPFARAGADHVTFHAEAAPTDEALRLAALARGLGLTAGLAFNPPTPLEPHADALAGFDLILVMSVNPGFSGQAFIPEVLAKAQQLRRSLVPDARLQIDGGVTPANAPRVRDAGIDVLVAASAIFSKPPGERARAISDLRGH